MNKIKISLSIALAVFVSMTACRKVPDNVSSVEKASYPTITILGSQFYSIPVGGSLPAVAATAYDSIIKESYPVSLDARSIEIVPGASSALYGPNAFNGTLLMTSKSPYQYPGFSAQVKGGFTYAKESGIKPLGSLSFRVAEVFKRNWAVKVNFSVLNGKDWMANDYTTDKISQQNGVGNPDFDGLNLYGDERAIPVSVSRFKTTLLNVFTPQFASYFGGDLVATKNAALSSIGSV